MNQTFLAVCGAVALSAAIAGAQDKSSSTSSNSGTAANTVTFTGCLNSGTTGDTFYLMKAKQKGAKTTDKSLKVVLGDPKVGLSRFVTQEVELTGTVDPAEPPAEATAEGAQQVRTLSVTKVKLRGESCG